MKDAVALLAVVGVSALLLVPRYQEYRRRANYVRLQRNARTLIHVILFARPDYSGDIWKVQARIRNASPEDFRSSTDLFRLLVSHYWPASWDTFSIAPCETYRGSDPEGFGPRNNTWCILSEAERVSEALPWLFTDNILIDQFRPGRIPDFEVNRYLKDHAVYMSRGGAAFTVHRDWLLTWNTESCTNVVLRP